MSGMPWKKHRDQCGQTWVSKGKEWALLHWFERWRQLDDFWRHGDRKGNGGSERWVTFAGSNSIAGQCQIGVLGARLQSLPQRTLPRCSWSGLKSPESPVPCYRDKRPLCLIKPHSSVLTWTKGRIRFSQILCPGRQCQSESSHRSSSEVPHISFSWDVFLLWKLLVYDKALPQVYSRTQVFANVIRQPLRFKAGDCSREWNHWESILYVQNIAPTCYHLLVPTNQWDWRCCTFERKMKAKKAADSVVVTLTVPPPPLPPSFLFVARFGQA